MAKQALKKISKLPGAPKTLKNSPLQPSIQQINAIGSALKAHATSREKDRVARTVAPYKAGTGDVMYSSPRSPSQATNWFGKMMEQTSERRYNKVRTVKTK